MAERVITRRDFLRTTAGVTAAAAVGAGILAEAQTPGKVKVILVRDLAALNDKGEVQAGAVQTMLDQAVKALLGEPEPLGAWKKLFQRADVVGVKSNSWGRMPTPKEIEAAIRSRLLDAGVAEKNIDIDDRNVLQNPLFQKATALVNVRPLRTHHWSGVGTCLKNYIQFVPSPSSYHAEGCSDLGKIWTLPLVKGKTRLNILCALMPQFYGRGANFFDRRYLWPYRGLLVGTDPVAVDAVGAHLLQTKRIAFFGEDRSLDVPPVHISVADKKYHIGVSDLARIEVVKIGWMEDGLI